MSSATQTPAPNAPAPANVSALMQTINTTPLDKIVELDFVKQKYITNYNTCNANADGELMYHRNLVFIKQAISGFGNQKVDPFSVYACITTMAVDGLSAAPIDEEVYLYPKDGKMFLQKQAGAYVKRLVKTGQVKEVVKVNLVYEGDVFKVADGFVTKHEESFASDKIIAGYIKLELISGKEKHFVYRPSDWESWRASSPQLNGPNWRFTPPGSPQGYVAFQPKPGFLKTKIIAHACKEKSWTPGRTPATVEVYNVYTNEDEEIPGFTPASITADQIPPITESEEIKETPATPAPAATTNDDEHF